MSYRIALSLLFASLFFVNTASAQNWSFDARKIGMSPTGGENLASRMIEEENDYRAIVLPFGLIQVFRDFDRLNPSNDEFDIARTVEYAAAPLHYTIGRDSSDSKADDFLVDIANGELSRDLNDYNGFIPVNQLGLLTVNPFLPAPLLVSRIHADSGTGMAIDVGVGAVIRNWEVGFGANGISNFIDWTDAEQTTDQPPAGERRPG